MIQDTLIVTSPALIIAIPLLFSFLISLIGRFSKRLTKVFFTTALILTFLFVGLMTYEILTEGSWFYVFGAEEPSPRNIISYFRISFLADSFGALGTITMSITAICIGIFSHSYMEGENDLEKYYALFLITLAGINGMILTSDLFNMFV
ncbi:MAG: hypothetical protein ACOC87_02085 [Candidatus Natronoplasma sp.]